MIHSLHFRLATGALVAIALVLIATGYFLSSVFTDYVVQRYQGEMGAIVDQLSSRVEVEQGALVLKSEPGDPRFALPASGRYWQINPLGGEVRRSASLWDTTLSPSEDVDTYGFRHDEGPDGEPVLVLLRPLSIKDGDRQYPFQVLAAFPVAEFDLGLQDYHSALKRMLLLTAIVLTAAAYLQGAVGLKPLVRLRESVTRVRRGELMRIAGTGPSEVRPLVAELNLLLSEREHAVERARARASDLAHGLKTPLTVLLQLCDRLPETERKLAYQQVELVRQRADRQLQAARLGVEQMVSTQLASLVGKLVLVLGPVTRSRGIDWIIEVPRALVVQADAADIAECLGNILDNATKWSKTRIAVRARLDGSWIEVSVLDDGPGVDPSDYPRIVARGGQAAEADSEQGSGLGLAISHDIATAYGGSLAFDRSPLGGLQVLLRLPAAEATRAA